MKLEQDTLYKNVYISKAKKEWYFLIFLLNKTKHLYLSSTFLSVMQNNNLSSNYIYDFAFALWWALQFFKRILLYLSILRYNKEKI